MKRPFVLVLLLSFLLLNSCKGSKKAVSENKNETPFEIKQDKEVPNQTIINGVPQQNTNTGARPK
ncbi:MAG: hypothetical protein JNL69_09610 [Bacteroidia bacterium]|nr:hypothetical protein [Bacteroidia bacterium]